MAWRADAERALSCMKHKSIFEPDHVIHDMLSGWRPVRRVSNWFREDLHEPSEPVEPVQIVELVEPEESEEPEEPEEASTHSDFRLIMCAVKNCGREYISWDHLKRHFMTHKGDLFVCTWKDCKVTFSEHLKLQRHLKLHEEWEADHPGESTTPDALLSCPEPQTLLNSHIENVHDNLSAAHGIPDKEKESKTEDFEFQSGSPSRKRVKLEHDDDRSRPDQE